MQTAQQRWIYISPHLDDVILSCGGLIWEQVQMGLTVEVWTIFSGDPPSEELTPFADSLHERWGTLPGDAIRQRREEDIEACHVIGAAYQHYSFMDCIYRRHEDSRQPVVQVEDDLFQRGYKKEKPLSEMLSALFRETLSEADILVAPYGIGGHIDHQLVHAAANSIPSRIWFYADYPYASQSSNERSAWQDRSRESYLIPVSSEGLEQWQIAVGAYTSQISTFWQDIAQMKRSLRDYWGTGGGSLLRRF